MPYTSLNHLTDPQNLIKNEIASLRRIKCKVYKHKQGVTDWLIIDYGVITTASSEQHWYGVKVPTYTKILKEAVVPFLTDITISQGDMDNYIYLENDNMGFPAHLTCCLVCVPMQSMKKLLNEEIFKKLSTLQLQLPDRVLGILKAKKAFETTESNSENCNDGELKGEENCEVENTAYVEDINLDLCEDKLDCNQLKSRVNSFCGNTPSLKEISGLDLEKFRERRVRLESSGAAGRLKRQICDLVKSNGSDSIGDLLVNEKIKLVQFLRTNRTNYFFSQSFVSGASREVADRLELSCQGNDEGAAQSTVSCSCLPFLWR